MAMENGPFIDEIVPPKPPLIVDFLSFPNVAVQQLFERGHWATAQPPASPAAEPCSQAPGGMEVPRLWQMILGH